MGETKDSKPTKGLDDWVKNQYVGNLIRNIINFLIFPALVFWLVGDTLNNLVITFQGFLLVYFTVIPLMVINDAIVDSQNAYLDGKWEIKEDIPADPSETRPSLWRRFAHKILIFGLIPALLSYLVFWIYIWISGSDAIPLDPTSLLVLAAFIALIPTFIITYFWIKRNLSQELSGFVRAISKPKPSQPVPFLRYFVWEHALPWSIILALLNLAINLKGFAENFAKDGIITEGDLAYSVWITTLVLLLWMGLSAMNQVRADVHLGRVKESRPLPLWIVILLVIFIPIVAGSFVYLGAIISGVYSYTTEFCTIIIIIDAIIAGVLGRYLGIWLGKNSEFKKIK